MMLFISLLLLALGGYALLNPDIGATYAIISFIIGGILLTGAENKTKRRKKHSNPTKKAVSTTKMKNTKNTNNTRSSYKKRPDDVILKLKIEDLSGWEFERIIYLYYKDLGYKPILTKEGADGGIDIIYTNPHTYEKVAVQVKHWKNPVGTEIIRATDNAAKRNYGIYLTEIISSGTISNPALVEMDKYSGMDPKDGRWVKNNVVPWMEKKASKL